MSTTDTHVTLRELTWLKPSYIIPRHDFVSDALIPCLQVAETYRGMAGFFDSGALRDIAPGLADYLSRPGKTVRLIASPYIAEHDQKALREGLTTPAKLLEDKLLALCGTTRVTQSALAEHTLLCLSYLIASNRLQFKVSLVPGGLFHPKVWIFEQAGDVVALHGSSNLTTPGLLHNVEQITVSRSWRGEDQVATLTELADEFETLWIGGRDYAQVFDLPDAVTQALLRRLPPTPPTPEDFWEAWREDHDQGIVDVEFDSPLPPPVKSRPFGIPAGLNYRSGSFEHQGRAIDAWETAGRRGILAMATGAGKTSAALVAAQRFHKEVGKLLIVVAAPYLPLIEQWREEARLFGLSPVVPNDTPSRAAKYARIDSAIRALNLGAADVACLVVSHDMLCDIEFHAAVARCNARSLLIGDEVHNLGRDTFIANPPESFTERLGLSATPERQYDDDGTRALTAYFGPVVFRFTLKDAIGVCLVPYEYYAHPIELTPGEALLYANLTHQLARLGWKGQGPSLELEDRIQQLLIRRRKIVEQAEGKVACLATLLRHGNPRALHHTLVYASSRGRDQLLKINALLSELDVHFHQLTAEETSQPRLAATLLATFAAGGLQVLTAMKVLDEGVNIPQIETAYIVASTTVEREWVQRRGRVLRRCNAIGKSSATIHDFVVLPPPHAADDVRGLLKSELNRIREFASLASNAGASDGGFRQVQTIIGSYFT